MVVQKSSPLWQPRPAKHFVQLTACPQLLICWTLQPLLTPAHVVDVGSGTQLGTQVPPWQVEVALHEPRPTVVPQLFTAVPHVGRPRAAAFDSGTQTHEPPLQVVPPPQVPQLTPWPRLLVALPQLAPPQADAVDSGTPTHAPLALRVSPPLQAPQDTFCPQVFVRLPRSRPPHVVAGASGRQAH